MRLTTEAGLTTTVTGPMLMGQPGRRPAAVARCRVRPRTRRRKAPPPIRGRSGEREWQAYVEEQARLRMWAGVSHEVVHRLVGMNLRHGMHAWSVRRDRPVAPWAVGFLYAYPTGTVYDGVALYRVVAATRLVDQDDELPGPAHLLYRLAEIGRPAPTRRARLARPDPTVHLPRPGSRHRDLHRRRRCPAWAPRLSRGTRFAGATATTSPGTATPCSPTTPRCMFTRAGRRDLRRVAVHATADLSHQHHRTGRRWVAHHNVQSMPDTDLDVWDQLYRLHVLAGHQRPAADPCRPTAPGGTDDHHRPDVARRAAAHPARCRCRSPRQPREPAIGPARADPGRAGGAASPARCGADPPTSAFRPHWTWTSRR